MFFSSCDSLVGDSLEFIKQIEAHYVFDWENAIALHAMEGAHPLHGFLAKRLPALGS